MSFADGKPIGEKRKDFVEGLIEKIKASQNYANKTILKLDVQQKDQNTTSKNLKVIDELLGSSKNTLKNLDLFPICYAVCCCCVPIKKLEDDLLKVTTRFSEVSG